MERPRRRYHLGLDWGTSSIKMILRDYGAPGLPSGLALVLDPEQRGLRSPSTVTLVDGPLYFGWQAEARRSAKGARVWDSIKAQAGARAGWAVPAGSSGVLLRDMVALTLAHGISLGFGFATRHADAMKAAAIMGVSVGAPEADLEVHSEEYLAASQVAYRLAMKGGFDPQGERLDRCMEALRGVRTQILPGMDTSAETRRRWLRSEVAAAMMWVYESPRIGEGAYTVVDIGAATTNASYFRIHGVNDADGVYRTKAAISFFGAESRPPGMDEPGQALAQARGFGETPVQLRGQEKPLYASLAGHRDVKVVTEAIHETWAQARRNAWPRSNTLTHWDGLRYLVVGGGSTVPPLVERFVEPPGYFKGKIKGYNALHDPGRPRDLRSFPDQRPGSTPPHFTQPHTFLLVAYGLSFHPGDLPDISLPGEVPRFRREEFRRKLATSEELGYAQK